MTTSLVELFAKGGPVMWPILACSILAVAITIERWLALGRVPTDPRPFLQKFHALLAERRLDQARKLCDGTTGPLPKIAEGGLSRYGRPREEIEEQLEEAVLAETPGLTGPLPALGTIAHLSPLLGLLGTVTGLVKSFQTIQLKAVSAAPVNPADLAGGIWEALLTTVFGLAVAIPAYALYNYFAHRVNLLNRQMEGAIAPLARTLAGTPDSK